jgi:hypothetical protein
MQMMSADMLDRCRVAFADIALREGLSLQRIDRIGVYEEGWLGKPGPC